METFFAEYSRQLYLAVQNNPDEYRYGVDKVPEVLVKIKAAIAAGTFSKDSRAFRETCKSLKIKHTYKDIARFITNHV